MDSENDNDKVDMPLFPSPEPTIGYSDDLDYFKDFETKFPAIIYNDALTSKLDSLTEPTNLHVSIGIPFEPKRYYKDGVYTRILWRPRMVKIHNMGTDPVLFTNMETLQSRDQRHPWLKYQAEGYTKDIVHSYKKRLEVIFGRLVNRVHMLYFDGLAEKMRQTLAGRLRMIYTGDEGQELFTSHACGKLFEIKGLDPVRRLCHRMISCSIFGKGQAPEKAWVASGPERQPDAVAGALESIGNAPAVDVGALANPTPMQAPYPLHASPNTMPQRIARHKEEVYELR
nr:hypothetical protein [Tanacetum cinerariifolium]